MAKTLVVCGHGPGISSAVARRFGREGYAVALVARSGERLAQSAKKLESEGIKAQAYPRDLGNPAHVRAMLQEVKASLGPVNALHWNAYTGGAADLTTAPLEELSTALNSSVFGLVAAVQAALPDLKANHGAVLVTGGGFCFYDQQVDAMATQFGAQGLAVAKAAQHKTVALLREKLTPEGVYVGEVVVTGLVKGTAFDAGSATLDPKDIAAKFWELNHNRTEGTVLFG